MATKKKPTKKMMLDELMDIIEEYNQDKELVKMIANSDNPEEIKERPRLSVKPADKIAAIAKVCQLMGFNEPDRIETTNKTITLQF